MNNARTMIAPRPARITLADPDERLGWLVAGGLVAGLFVVWLFGLWLHAGSPEAVAIRPATEVIRSDAQRPLAMRELRFEAAGTALVAVDADTGASLRNLGFERDGFIVSIVRSLERQRRQLGVPATAAYRLSRWDNGQVLFEDTATGTQLELSAFGSGNAAAVATLLLDTASEANSGTKDR